MLRRTALFLLVMYLSGGPLAAQSPPFSTANGPTNWINYRQTYFKIPIIQTGIYRITATELQRAGVPINSIDPTTLQLIHRGIEQAVYVVGEVNKRFTTDGFLEFYGRGNDGWQDSLLYQPDAAGKSSQPHPHYSLFSDTTAYFLTWRLDGQAGRRMPTYTDTTTTGLTPEPYHWADDLRLFTDTYPGYPAGIPPKIEYSFFEPGEGYTGLIQHRDVLYTNRFVTQNAWRSGPAPQVDILLVGRDYTAHRVEWQLGPTATTQRTAGTIDFSLYNNVLIRQPVDWPDISSDGQLIVSTASRSTNSPTDQYSVSFIRLQYPQILSANNQPQYPFQLLPNAVGRSLLNVTEVPADARFWDITDPNAPVMIGATASTTGTVQLVVRSTNTERKLLCASQVRSIKNIRPVRFTDWSTRRPAYVIISHERLMAPVSVSTGVGSGNAIRDYAAYRASAAGGGYDTLTTTVQPLFDQFSYGERHPLAIRRFADQLLRQSVGLAVRPQYLLLLGRSRSTPGIRHDPSQATLDLVPTYGFPPSDILFTVGLDGNPRDVPAIPTGRVNAGTPAEVLGYLNKVKEHEALPAGMLWRKRVLHLSGGETAAEATAFRRVMDGFRDQITGHSLGAGVTTFAKQTDNPVERINVAKPINEGVGLITFLGHSGLDVTDLDIGFCSNDALNYHNRGRYPLLLINGCALGNFFFGRPTLTADWVLTPGRGAIAAIAQSHLGYPDVLARYSTIFYSLLADSLFQSQSIGQLQQETIRQILAQTPAGLDLANTQQMVLQGDPAIRLFPFDTPDYALTADNLRMLTPFNPQSDSVRIELIVQNAGQYRTGKLPVQVRRLVNGRKTGVFDFTLPNAVAFSDTLVLTLPNQASADGKNQFEVTLNPAGSSGKPALPETNLSNNQAIIDLTEQPLPTQPDRLGPLLEVAFDGSRIADNAVVSAQPVIDVLVADENQSLIRRDTVGLHLFLQRPGTNEPFVRLNWQNAVIQPGSNTVFRIRYESPLLVEGNYQLLVTATDVMGNAAVPYQVRFRVINNRTLTGLTVYPNPFHDQTRFAFQLTGDRAPDGLTLLIHDLTGRVVRHLNTTFSGPATARLTPRIGLNEWFWDGRADSGELLPAGIYVYKLSMGETDPVWSAGESLRGRVILTR